MFIKKRILIIDDDEDLLELFSFLLTETGYDVKIHSSAENVFSLIYDYEPHLILLDVMLGWADGRSICEQLKAQPQTNTIPVIMISGRFDLNKCSDPVSSPDDFIRKPFKIDHLIKKIEKQLSWIVED